ncbi:MAG: tetratricopeptide repeat protein [Acidobacteriaceae bacterium]|nr:tetratricopeptide repeat protein [Acidobacteriaceae bacterium]
MSRIRLATLAFVLCIIYAIGLRISVRASEAPVTYNRQIAPILYKNCTTCHHPGGGGPFSLLTYEDARRREAQVVQVTASRYMPPWLPEHGYGDFADERRLSDEEIALIRRWVAAGMPRGDDPPPSVPRYDSTWTLGKPDLVLTVERPSTLPASGSDIFLNFVLPDPLDQTHNIRAMEIRPGTPQVVHHANILIDRTASWRRQHPDTWRDGIPGMELMLDAGNTFDPDSHFLFWKPDTPALVEPDGMPWRLDPGNDLILNMHIKPSGKPETIAAQIGLYFTDAPPSNQPMLLQLEHDAALDIPPGKSDFVITDQLKLPIDVDVLGIYPHAHYLGKDLQGYAILPNGEKKWLIWIRSWDIDRQSVYRYRKPVFLPRGSIIHMRYTYDNSTGNVHNPNDPPVRVHAGNRSVDEMGHLWLQVLPVNTPPNSPDPRLLLETAWMQDRLRKNPGDTMALYNLAAAETAEAKYAEAVQNFKRVVDLNPKDARAWNGLGVALENSGDWQSAQQAFQKASAADPEMTDAVFNLGRSQLEHSDPALAEQSFRAVLARSPYDASAHVRLAQALLRQDNEDGAQLEFESALRIQPDNADALEGLGQIALGRGQLAQAIPLLENASQRSPDDPTTRQQLALAYAQSGRYTEAVQQLKEAQRLSPGDPQVHAMLSQVYSAMHNLQQAISEQQQVLRLNASDPDAWNNLGVLEVRAGNSAAAREDFEHALRISSNHAAAKANLARLNAGEETQ